MKIEDILALPGARIQVLIKEDTEIGQYNDALYYSTDEVDKMVDSKEIDAAAKLRVDNWIAFVQEQSSKPPYIPTKEELIAIAEQQFTSMEAATGQLINAAEITKVDLQVVADKLQAYLDVVKANISTKVDVIVVEPIVEEIIKP